MGLRLLSPPHDTLPLSSKISFSETPGTYSILRKLCGIAEGYKELSGKTALESNQDWLNAISFQKGCYLGQELTARSNFTGVIRKRILPMIIYDDRTQIPTAWLRVGMDGTTLPRLSAVDAATIMLATQYAVLDKESQESTLSGNFNKNKSSKKQEYPGDNTKYINETQLQLEEAFSVTGAKLLDAESCDTIGEIISPIGEGSSIVLAQMRMDRVGIMKEKKWSAMQKLVVKGSNGSKNSKEWRYLPYLPLWWPPMVDSKTGKEVEKAVPGNHINAGEVL